MALTTEEVTHVAMLARIALDEQQTETLHAEINSIFEHIDTLQAVDVQGVEPMVHPISMCNVMREDEVHPSLAIETALKNAPARDGNAFLVPRIVAPGGDA